MPHTREDSPKESEKATSPNKFYKKMQNNLLI